MSGYEGNTEMDGESPFVEWGTALLEEPDAALDRILSGTGGRDTQQRAEPDDFLADLLANPSHRETRAKLTERLDAAVLKWIETRSEWSTSRIAEFGPRAYAAQMADALAVAARLSLTATACELVRNHVTWDDRFRAMRRPGDIDLLREFDVVLAQHQTDIRFSPRWFAACDEAAWGSPYWRTRLGIGLLGLRKLPTPSGTVPEQMVATGLARFAALGLSRGMNPHLVESTFRQRAASMTVLYPRHIVHWSELWDTVIDGLRRRHDEHAVLLKSWLAPTGERSSDSIPQQRRTDVKLPERRRLEWLEQDIDETTDLCPDLWDKVRSLVRDHWHYAFASGESYYAVRTTTNICNRLLRIGLDERAAAEIHKWARQTVEAEPENSYTWDLWAKTLSTQGHGDAALSVRWESIRRFPESSVLRNSLAYLLAEHDRHVLAEHLLRETMRDFHDDPFCRSILANLLIKTERDEEAEHLLRETARSLPGDTVSRHTLTWMLWRQGRRDDAMTELAALQSMNADDAHIKRLSDRIDEHQLTPEALAEDELISIYGEAGIAQDGPVPGASLTDPTAEEQVIDLDGNDSAVAFYLSRLQDRTDLMEQFFASSQSSAATSHATTHDYATSELALVAAHRAGLLEEAEGREELRTWAAVRPSSYSARLLLVWRGNEADGLDRAAMSEIEDEFPEHHEWNKRLRYGFNSLQTDELQPKAASNRSARDSDRWASRLLAVYPSLMTKENDAGTRVAAAAWRRLMEDIAFAGAERAVPIIAPR